VWCVNGVFETVVAGSAFTDVVWVISRCLSLLVIVVYGFWGIVYVDVMLRVIGGRRSFVFMECVVVWEILFIVCVIVRSFCKRVVWSVFIRRSFILIVGVVVVVDCIVVVTVIMISVLGSKNCGAGNRSGVVDVVRIRYYWILSRE
jgi:hypothetical protein